MNKLITLFAVTSLIFLAGCSLNVSVNDDSTKSPVEVPALVQPVEIAVDEPVDEPEEEFEPTVMIEDESVYLINALGGKVLIAEAVTDAEDALENKKYEKAAFSPDGRFVLLGEKGYEWTIVRVYNVLSGETHQVDESSTKYADWLEDGRLRIVGECGMGISCGTFESVDSDQPWIVEKIEE